MSLHGFFGGEGGGFLPGPGVPSAPPINPGSGPCFPTPFGPVCLPIPNIPLPFPVQMPERPTLPIPPPFPGVPGGGGGAGGAQMVGCCPSGFKMTTVTDRCTGQVTQKCVKRRRMNPLNPRALSRATRRLTSFNNRIKSTQKQLRKLAGPARRSRQRFPAVINRGGSTSGCQ